MRLSCPKCRSQDVRVSHRKGLGEHVRALFGIYPLRCRRCRSRWATSVWASGDWKYARCPRCHRQELTTWSEQDYRPPGWTLMVLRFGAVRYRCPVCRCNFASFRRCKDQTEPATPASASEVRR